MNRWTAHVTGVVALLVAGLAGLPACAAEPPAPAALLDSAAARTINMGVGKSLIIELPQDAAEIFVGNPKVANAIVRTARKLYIVAIDNGQTSIFAMDRAGRQIARSRSASGAMSPSCSRSCAPPCRATPSPPAPWGTRSS